MIKFYVSDRVPNVSGHSPGERVRCVPSRRDTPDADTFAGHIHSSYVSHDHRDTFTEGSRA